MKKIYRYKLKNNSIEDLEILKKELINLYEKNDNIKFVSLVAVDLGNNYTDEKIPFTRFLENLDDIIKDGIQTDGSSVNLPLIATINNARVDLIPDLNADWIVDYNTDIVEKVDGFERTEIGTLQIPAFLKHNNEFVDSRYILKKSISNFEKELYNLFIKYPNLLEYYNIDINEIEKFEFTTATELEFWVKSPDDKADIEALSTSQQLKEQYWKRTTGAVRNAIEHVLIELENYQFKPEMAHKEVGGIKSKISNKSDKIHIMEQLEIDWKYSDPMTCIDNERIAKNIISDTFRNYFLDVSFDAKPIEDVAGSGEHHHIGVGIKLKNGNFINLLTAKNMNEDYLSIIGYGAIMGILKNYEVINPFVSSNYDAFNRLKPGFEAPVCIVASLGVSPQNASRNRTVLLCLIRDLKNPNSVRFELRSPNPKSNSYLLLAATFQSMLDGIKYAIENGLNEKELLKELNKDFNENASYLENKRKYVSEDDIFEKYPDYNQTGIFGQIPNDVYELIEIMNTNSKKLNVIKSNNVFTDKIINSYTTYILENWIKELKYRIIIDNELIIKSLIKLHKDDDDISEMDVKRWNKIRNIKWELVKHNENGIGIFDKLKEAIEQKDYKKISELQKQMQNKMKILNNMYTEYKHKLLI